MIHSKHIKSGFFLFSMITSEILNFNAFQKSHDKSREVWERVRLFRLIHRRKRELLELYNSLNGTCYTNAEELELVVTQYNINEGHNEKLLAESSTLHGYAVFVGKTRRFHDSGLAVDESVKHAVDECIREHILEDIFRENYEEVVKMGEAEFWEELHYRTMEKELREEGIKEGISRLIIACKELGVSREKTLEQLEKQYQLDTETAEKSMTEHW